MKKTKTEVQKEVKEEEHEIKYVIHQNLVKPCIEFRVNPFVGKQEIGLHPFFFGSEKQNIGVKETTWVDDNDIFENEEEAERVLLQRKTNSLGQKVSNYYDYIEEWKAKTDKLTIYLFILCILNFIGFIYLTAVIK